MKIVTASKAENIFTHDIVTGVEIHITKGMPNDEDLSTHFDKDAKAIATALADNLPGGVFDRLLSELLAIKSCQLRIPHGGTRC